MEKVSEPRRCECGRIIGMKGFRCGMCAKLHSQKHKQREKGLRQKRAEYWIAENI